MGVYSFIKSKSPLERVIMYHLVTPLFSRCWKYSTQYMDHGAFNEGYCLIFPFFVDWQGVLSQWLITLNIKTTHLTYTLNKSVVKHAKVSQGHIFMIWQAVCYVPLHAWEIFPIFSSLPALLPPKLLRVSSYSFVSDKSEKFVLGESDSPECIVSGQGLLSCTLSCFSRQLDTQAFWAFAWDF